MNPDGLAFFVFVSAAALFVPFWPLKTRARALIALSVSLALVVLAQRQQPASSPTPRAGHSREVPNSKEALGGLTKEVWDARRAICLDAGNPGKDCPADEKQYQEALAWFIGPRAPLPVAPEAKTSARPAQSISVPSDARARYTALELIRKSGTQVEVVTMREGPSGTTFAKRRVNCSNMTFKYLSEGDRLEDLKRPTPDSRMSPLVSGSISDYVSRWACGQK